jgi:serine/threonine protein kinase
MSHLPQHKIGTKVDGKTLVRIIGEGSFATVFLATDENNNNYAVKCLFKQGLTHRELRAQLAEAKLLARLSHPNIVSLIKTVDDEDAVYLIQEYCQTDLFDSILRTKGYDETLTKQLFAQVCDAVAYIHSKSVYHRDIKPENILLKDGVVKLADFGLATTDELCDDFQVGSNRYMSPEVYTAEQSETSPFKLPYSAAANDVWALGIVLINMLTGRNPWSKPTLTDKRFKRYFSGTSKTDPSPSSTSRPNSAISFERCLQKTRSLVHPRSNCPISSRTCLFSLVPQKSNWRAEQALSILSKK